LSAYLNFEALLRAHAQIAFLHHLGFRDFGAVLSNNVQDREMLRLVKAFNEIASKGTRRALVLLIKRLAQKKTKPRKTRRPISS
jgi:hypothetical protein